MSQSKTSRSYRAIFILDTRELQDSMESLIQKIKGAVISLDAKVSETVNLGLRNFSHAVDRKFPAGYYLQLDFQGPATLPMMIQDRFRLDKMVNRIFIETV